MQTRLRQYGDKVEKVKNEKELKAAKKLTNVNIAAANRFISHAIPDLTKEQKQALRQVRVSSWLPPISAV